MSGWCVADSIQAEAIRESESRREIILGAMQRGNTFDHDSEVEVI